MPRPNASMSLHAKLNDIHQIAIIYLPHDKYKKKICEYALNIETSKRNLIIAKTALVPPIIIRHMKMILEAE